MSEKSTSSSTVSISWSFPVLVAGLIMKYAIEDKPGGFNFETAGNICILLGLIPLAIVLLILVVCGLVLGLAFALDASDRRKAKKRRRARR